MKYSVERERKGVTRPNWARKVREMIVDMGENNRRYGKVVFFIPEKGLRRKEEKLFGKGKYFLCDGKRKEGKILLGRRGNTENEKEENIWRRKTKFGGGGEKREKYLETEKIFCGGEEEQRRKRRQISLRRKDWCRPVDGMVWVDRSKVFRSSRTLKQGTLTGEGARKGGDATKKLAMKMGESVLDKKGVLRMTYRQLRATNMVIKITMN